MARLVHGLLLALTLLLGATSCGGDSGDGGDGSSAGGTSGAASGTPGQAGGSDVLTWGDGDYGVVLAHGSAFDAASWEEQATAIAEQGTSVVAVEDISPEGIAAAVQMLQDAGIAEVALVGGSAGADGILRLAAEQPDLPDQLVLISPNTVVEGLGEEPKLFIASEGEPGSGIPQELVDVSPGDDNQTLIVSGSAHAQNIFDTDQGPEVLAAVLERLSAG